MNCKEDKPMKHTMKKLAALLLALVMVLALTTVTAFAGTPAEPVPYLDAQVDDTTHAVTYTPATCTDYTPVASATDAVTWGKKGETTWYVVKENVTIANVVTFTGDVRLILCDGATLTVNNTAANGYGIRNSGSASASLTVYAQSTGANIGVLVATGQDFGIRGGNSAVTINGGDLRVNGKHSLCVENAALTINGGKVTATADGSDKSAAIREIYGGLTVNGGTVIATGGQYGIRIAKSLTVNGGEITANGTEKAITSKIEEATVTIASGLRVDAGADKDSAQPVEGYNKEKWVHIYAIPQPEPTPAPTPVYHSEETPSAALTVTSEIGTITRVTVDGKELSSADYAVFGNSVVLSDAFMRSLANGTHTIRLYDGVTYATATWTVTGNTIVAPKTADPGLAIYAALAVSATLGLGYMGKRKED